MKDVHFRLPDETVDLIDQAISMGIFKSRSDVLRAMVIYAAGDDVAQKDDLQALRDIEAMLNADWETLTLLHMQGQDDLVRHLFLLDKRCLALQGFWNGYLPLTPEWRMASHIVEESNSESRREVDGDD